jgi:hypothetical protein
LGLHGSHDKQTGTEKREGFFNRIPSWHDCNPGESRVFFVS